MKASKKRVKIVSDGTSVGTMITYDGHPFGMVTKLKIDINVDDELAMCRMEVILPEFEMEFRDEAVEIGSKSFKKCPACGKWIAPESTFINSVDMPVLKYKCHDCNWEESVAVPITVEQEEKEPSNE